MNIEKLDSLLRSKLQWEESEVHENELKAVFEKMGIRKKKSSGLLFGILAFCLLSAGVVAYMLNEKQAVLVSANEVAVINPAITLADQESAGSFESQRTEEQEKSAMDKTKASENDKVLLSASSQSSNLKASSDASSEAPQIITEKGAHGSGIHAGFKNRANKNAVNATAYNNETAPGSQATMVSDRDQTELYNVAEATSEGLNRIKGLRKSNYAYQFSTMNLSENLKMLNIPILPLTRSKFFARLMTATQPELSLWVSPMMSSEHARINKGDEERVHEAYAEHQKRSEGSVFTINSGLKLQFTLFSVLRIGTGIGYFQTGNSYHYDYLINRIPVYDSASGRVVTYFDKPDSFSQHIVGSGKHIAKYMEIPLSFRIPVLKRPNYTISVEPAYALQILLSSSGDYIDPKYLGTRHDKINKTRSGNFQFGVPVDFKINQRTTFTIMPYYGRALRSVTLDENVNRQRTYTGVKFSLNYRLYNP